MASCGITGYRADALGITADGADALVGLGVAMIAVKGAGEFRFGGQHVAWTRKVLVRTIELIGDGKSACRLQRQLTGDLQLVGGWVPGEH
jgi:hypothetical protein